MIDAERGHQYVLLQAATDITPFKDQTGEELFLSLIRRWLEFFHEITASFIQMQLCYRKKLLRNLSLLLTHLLLFCICTAQRKQDVQINTWHQPKTVDFSVPIQDPGSGSNRSPAAFQRRWWGEGGLCADVVASAH